MTATDHRPPSWLLSAKAIDRRLSLARRPAYRYVFSAAIISAVPVMIIITVAVFSGQLVLNADRLVTNWRFGSQKLTLAMGVLDVVLLSPLVETGLTLIPIRLLRAVKTPPRMIPVICGLFWGLVHTNYNGTLLGLVAIWPFYCFTSALIAFEKPSLDQSWVIASSIHALHNIACLLVSVLLVRY